MTIHNDRGQRFNVCCLNAPAEANWNGVLHWTAEDWPKGTNTLDQDRRILRHYRDHPVACGIRSIHLEVVFTRSLNLLKTIVMEFQEWLHFIEFECDWYDLDLSGRVAIVHAAQHLKSLRLGAHRGSLQILQAAVPLPGNSSHIERLEVDYGEALGLHVFESLFNTVTNSFHALKHVELNVGRNNDWVDTLAANCERGFGKGLVSFKLNRQEKTEFPMNMKMNMNQLQSITTILEKLSTTGTSFYMKGEHLILPALPSSRDTEVPPVFSQFVAAVENYWGSLYLNLGRLAYGSADGANVSHFVEILQAAQFAQSPDLRLDFHLGNLLGAASQLDGIVGVLPLVKLQGLWIQFQFDINEPQGKGFCKQLLAMASAVRQNTYLEHVCFRSTQHSHIVNVRMRHKKAQAKSDQILQPILQRNQHARLVKNQLLNSAHQVPRGFWPKALAKVAFNELGATPAFLILREQLADWVGQQDSKLPAKRKRGAPDSSAAVRPN